MDRTNLIISYFRLSEKEKNELFLDKGTQQILKIGLFAVGNAHFAVVEDDGTVTAYGDNSKGQCNTKSWKNVRKVVAGNFHTAALTNDGKVYATGDNTFGQCNVRQWSGVTELFADRNLTVGVKSDGKLLVSHPAEQAVHKKPEPKQKRAPEKAVEIVEGYEDTVDGKFGYTVINGKIRIGNYFGAKDTVVVPETICNMAVYSIGPNAFMNNAFIKWVKLPGSLREINPNAFKDCSQLEFVSIPFGVKKIGHHAFSNCNIKTLYLPESVANIGEYAFSNCKSLNKVIVPDSVQLISMTAFEGCNEIETVDISEEAKKRIGDYRKIFNLK